MGVKINLIFFQTKHLLLVNCTNGLTFRKKFFPLRSCYTFLLSLANPFFLPFSKYKFVVFVKFCIICFFHILTVKFFGCHIYLSRVLKIQRFMKAQRVIIVKTYYKNFGIFLKPLTLYQPLKKHWSRRDLVGSVLAY